MISELPTRNTFKLSLLNIEEDNISETEQLYGNTLEDSPPIP
jgi:hypothetical protein